MSTVEHVLSGAGAPTNAPPSLGAHYIDTSTGELYLASGTGTPDDWRLAHSDSGWVTLEPIGSFLYPPDARKIGGVVHLRGFKWIELALLGEPLAQLPVGWRPAQQFYATKPIGDRIRRMSITEDGIEGAGMIFVDHVNGPTASDYFEFDGISFPVG